MKKIIKNKVKPAYVVDMTWCETVDDLKTELIFAKAGKAIISEDEIEWWTVRNIRSTMELFNMVDTCMKHVENILFGVFNTQCATPKKPWYKRIWNWLTGKKN